jgi:hypothetical protein
MAGSTQKIGRSVDKEDSVAAVSDVSEVPGVPIEALVLRDELRVGARKQHGSWTAGDTKLELVQGQESVWLVLSRGEAGGFALRVAYTPGPTCEIDKDQEDGIPVFHITSALGTYRVRLEIPDPARTLIRCTVRFTPEADLLTPFWPRDLYPIDANGDPLPTRGQIHAGQRGLNGGLIFLTLSEPCCGSLFYFQNLTALNDYFLATGTKPDGVVGGQWPELGYQPPTSPDAKTPPTKPLKAGEEIVLSDVFLSLRAEVPEDPRHVARLFLDLLADIYVRLERPQTEYHDWPKLAEATLRDLDRSPKATISHYGDRYVHPYTAFEYPDSMVQLTALTPLREFAGWASALSARAAKGKEAFALSDALWKGFHRFYDKNLQTIRRYLPNVGDDKNANEVDSWYLYHPLTNLGRLAKEGNEEAKELFFGSLDYAIRVAQHFEYDWPVQFDVRTLEVLNGVRKKGEPGQSDAGGIYAYVMIQAWEMTGEKRYLDEAKNAIAATKDRDFELAYQLNLTAWGVNACIHLYRITGEEFYRDQSYVFLANFFHNCVLWEPQLGFASNYRVFLGETCLHDAPYLAMYECFESFAAFHEYLSQGQEDLPDSVRLLVTEFLKYTLTRAWYFYPGHLPKETLASEIRNGHIDRNLAFPLEDLYADGQPAGQVGQEIYGCGAVFTFVTRSYNRFENAPFLFYCEYPISDVQDKEERRITLEVRGVEGMTCKARLVPTGQGKRGKILPALTLAMQEQEGSPEKALEGQVTEEGHCEFVIPASRRVSIRWEE